MKVRKENFNEIKKRLQEQFSNKDVVDKSSLESDQSKEKKFKKDKKLKKSEKFCIDTEGSKAEEIVPVHENKTEDCQKEEKTVAVTEQNNVKKKKKKKSNKKNKNNYISVGKTTSVNLEKFVEVNNVEESEKGQKRSLEDNGEVEAETEKKVKKPKREKKKKDNTVSNEKEENAEEKNEDGEPKKKKGPSIRELKRQKAEKRFQEAQNASRQKHSQEALNYISMWKHAKSEWKFNKVKQSWLIQNLLNEDYVPEEHYPTILEYFEDCKGHARKMLMDKAMAVIKKLEDSVEEGEEIVETVEYNRARQLLQALPNET